MHPVDAVAAADSIYGRAEAAGDYEGDPEATAAMAADEQAHALVVAGLAQRARACASGWFRAAVFGANDGPVSTSSLVLGMAGPGSSSRVILVAGLAGLLSGVAGDGRRRVRLGALPARAAGGGLPGAGRADPAGAGRAGGRGAGAGLPGQGRAR